MIHNHEFWWRFFPKKELHQVYLSAALRTFAISLIGVFIPLYLMHERGFLLEQTLSFFIFYSAVFAITTPIGAKIASKYGVKHSILFSVPFYLLFVGMLYSLPQVSIPLSLIAAVLGTSQGLYWIGMHMVFLHASHKNHRGEEIGKRRAFSIIVAMFGPLLGGFLISTVGFTLVFCLAALFLVISAIVLFFHKEEHVPYHFSVQKVLNKEHWKNSLFFVSKGTQVMANGVIWPIFIFSILGNYVSLGFAGSLLSGVSALLMWLVGKHSDRGNKRKIIRWITPFESISWFFKALIVTSMHVYGATIFGAITNGIRESPLGALEYDKARGDVAAYFVSREVFICLGRILLLMFVVMADTLTGGLIFQGFASIIAIIF